MTKTDPKFVAQARRGIPLRIRLSLGSALRLTVAMAAFALIAYQQVRRTALDAAADRARAAVLSMSTRSSVGMRDVMNQLNEVAADPAIIAALRSGTPSPEARAALARLTADTVLTVGAGLRNARGEMVIGFKASVPNVAFDESQSRDSTGVGRIRSTGDTLLYEATAPVLDGGTWVGSVVRLRRVTASPNSVRIVSDLMGGNGALLLGNADGSLWTDLSKPVDGPPSFEATRYRKNGKDLIVATRRIPTTPWAFAAEYPVKSVVAPLRSLIRDFTVIGGLLVLLGLIAGWWANARITRPLTELTRAAEGITAGHNPGAAPWPEGGDEMGRLQRSFQTMADSVWEAREELERKIRERTRALEDLKLTEDALRAADRRKDEFLAMLAHELRNPLAPIRNAAQVLKLKNHSDPDVQWSRDVIERQVAQMSLLLDDLLDLSRISHNRLELRLERVDLRAVLKTAIETSRPLIDTGGHELTVILPSHPIELEADPVRLAQVFSNLLNNSAKYSAGAGHIRLSAERHGDDVVITVSDDGIGITADALPNIWDMFTQARPALNQSRSGLGIGLSLVKGLVALHGGQVAVESEGAGRGSTFTVRLPLAAPAPAAGEVGISVLKPVAPSSRRILLADDLVDSVDSLSMLLRLMGHTVWTAQDGAEAFALAEVHRPEVLLLDLGMPRMDGYEACRRIREQPWGRDMMIVAVTGWGQTEDRRRTREAGFDRHVVKPVEPATLINLLDTRIGSEV